MNASTITEYSAGGFTVHGAMIGRDGFRTEAEAREYARHMASQPGVAPFFEIYAWDADGNNEHIGTEGREEA